MKKITLRPGVIDLRTVDGNRWLTARFLKGISFLNSPLISDNGYDLENSEIVEYLILALSAIFVARVRTELAKTAVKNCEINYFLHEPQIVDWAALVLDEVLFELDVDMKNELEKSVKRNILKIPRIMDEEYSRSLGANFLEDYRYGYTARMKDFKEQFLRAVIHHLVEDKGFKIAS